MIILLILKEWFPNVLSPQVQEEREIKIFSWMVERGNIGWGIGRQSGYLKIKKGEAATYQFFLVANDVARFQLSTRINGEVKIFCKVDADSDQKDSKLWVGRHMGEAWLDDGIYYYELVAINQNEFLFLSFFLNVAFS